MGHDPFVSTVWPRLVREKKMPSVGWRWGSGGGTWSWKRVYRAPRLRAGRWLPSPTPNGLRAIGTPVGLLGGP